MKGKVVNHNLIFPKVIYTSLIDDNSSYHSNQSEPEAEQEKARFQEELPELSEKSHQEQFSGHKLRIDPEEPREESKEPPKYKIYHGPNDRDRQNRNRRKPVVKYVKKGEISENANVDQGVQEEEQKPEYNPRYKERRGRGNRRGFKARKQYDKRDNYQNGYEKKNRHNYNERQNNYEGYEKKNYYNYNDAYDNGDDYEKGYDNYKSHERRSNYRKQDEYEGNYYGEKKKFQSPDTLKDSEPFIPSKKNVEPSVPKETTSTSEKGSQKLNVGARPFMKPSKIPSKDESSDTPQENFVPMQNAQAQYFPYGYIVTTGPIMGYPYGSGMFVPQPGNSFFINSKYVRSNNGCKLLWWI